MPCSLTHLCLVKGHWKPLGTTLHMLSLFQILLFITNILWWIVIIHIIMSWLINFQVLNLHQPLVSQIWYALSNFLEPIYRPIRNALPQVGGLDLAPLVFIVILFAVQTVIRNNAYAF